MNRILGILTMSSDAQGNPKHPLGVPFVKLVENSSVPHLGGRDEHLITHESNSFRCNASAIHLLL
ncbi:MAG TPA: hypothetical protein VFN26_05140 [Candidatus Acidoferrum sp.]|nr:hypothetical protein [Candidatus Acidoferrum sp.]